VARDHAGVFTDRPEDLVVGVIGGMGPLATVDLFHLLVKLTPADKDWNHLHIIVDDNPRIPSRSRAILFDEASPAPYMVEGAKRLVAMGAGVIAVPCNSASHFLAPARAAVTVPILDPVGATVAAVRARGVAKPFVLGGMVTHRADLYREVSAMRPTDSEQDVVAALIDTLKHGDTSAGVVARTQDVIAAGLARGADSVILGCTEFGLIADALSANVPVFNSNQLLAEQTVAMARRQ
jgi:aspartate racemase